ncbi:MAG: alpha/beta fold hydrolase [Armatimonadetes bacterium]|nr:alpha/beta fold hydrolase [Armatimonadota bacterium]
MNLHERCLYYEVHGTGRPVVLLAGYATDSSGWFLQTPALARRHRVILVDNRGVGRSPSPPGPWSIEAMAADTLAVLDRLGVCSAVLVGHSMGGAIAQRIALMQPERVSGLVLACSFARTTPKAAAILRSFGRSLAEGVSRELFVQLLLPWLFSPAFFQNQAAVDEAVTAFVNYPYPQSAEHNQLQVEAVLAHDTRDELRALSCPTMVLGAEEDLLILPPEARALAAAIPNASLELIPKAGHSCMVESPDLFTAAVDRFLASLG